MDSHLLSPSFATPSPPDDISIASTSTPPGQSSKAMKVCVICGSLTKNAHLGVEACRACAAFFKRTILTGKKYICRTGRRGCVIKLHEKFLCRRCRFDQCVAVGMTLDATVMWKMNRPSVIKLASSSSLPTCKDVYLLERISREYQASLQRRRDGEEALRATANYKWEEYPSAVHKDVKLFHSTLEFTVDALRIGIADLVQFCGRIFPEYAGVDLEIKHSHLKCFAGVFYTLEGYYLGEKFFPGGDKLFACSVTSCYDKKDLDSYLEGCKAAAERKEDLARAMQFYTNKSVQLTMPILRKAKLTDTEYHALLCILMWTFDHIHWVPDDIVDLGATIRQEIFEDLHRYYSTEGIEEYATRLGQLMSLAHTIQEANSWTTEELQMYKLLDLFKDDHFVSQLFLS